MTDSLKKMISSVDWSKMVSSDDARNALVGSALGGLMLGGASLARDRDPEESKMTPVGDALMGALLGGVSGYGIPKGLAMFSDGGHLAPGDDQLSGSGIPGAAGKGAILGGIGGAGLLEYKDLPEVRQALRRIWIRNAFNYLSSARGSADKLKLLKGYLKSVNPLSGNLTEELVHTTTPVPTPPPGGQPQPGFWKGIRQRLLKPTHGTDYTARDINILGFNRYSQPFELRNLRRLKYAGKGALLGALALGGYAALTGRGTRNNFKD